MMGSTSAVHSRDILAGRTAFESQSVIVLRVNTASRRKFVPSLLWRSHHNPHEVLGVEHVTEMEVANTRRKVLSR